MSDNVNLINQIYSQIHSFGVSFEQLNALSESDLNAIWSRIQLGEDISNIIQGFHLESAPDAAEVESLQKNKNTYPAENGDIITDSYNGDVLAERIIEKNGDPNNKIILTYSDGVLASSEEISAGTVFSSSSYAYTDEGVVITTDFKQSKGKRLTTVTGINQDDGSYTDENFIQYQATNIAGALTTVKKENGQIVVSKNGIEKIFDGDKISDYEKGNLREKEQLRQVKQRDLDLTNLIENFPETFDLLAINNPKVREIFQAFKVDNSQATKMTPDDMACIKSFILSVANADGKKGLSEDEIDAASKYIQCTKRIEDANFRDFLNTIINRPLPVYNDDNVDKFANGRQLVSTYEGGTWVATRLIDADGQELVVSADHPIKGYASYGRGYYIKGYTVVVKPGNDENTPPTYSTRKMVRSYSPAYQAQIRDFIINLHIATNENLVAQYDAARPDHGTWSCNWSDAIGDCIVDWFNSGMSPAEMYRKACDNIREAKELRDDLKNMPDLTYDEFQQIFHDRINGIPAGSLPAKMFDVLGIKDNSWEFNYLGADKFMRIAHNYVQANILKNQISELYADVMLISGCVGTDSKINDQGLSYLSKITGDLDSAKQLVAEYHEGKTDLTRDEWAAFFNKLISEFTEVKDYVISGQDDIDELTDCFVTCEDDFIRDLRCSSFEELESKFRGTYEVVFGEKIQDKEMDKWLNRGSIAGSIVTNLVISAAAGGTGFLLGKFASGGVRALFSRFAAGSRSTNVAAGLTRFVATNGIDFATDYSLRYATYGAKGREAISEHAGGDLLHTIFSNTAGAKIGSLVRNAWASKVALRTISFSDKWLKRMAIHGQNLIIKGSRPAARLAGAEGSKAAAAATLYDSTPIIQYSEYRADSLFQQLKDQNKLAELSPNVPLTVDEQLFANAIENIDQNQFAIQDELKNLSVIAYADNGETKYAVKNNDQIVYEAENGQDAIQMIASIGIGASMRCESFASAKKYIANEADTIRKEREVQYNTASTQFFTMDDVREMRGNNKKLAVHNGYVYDVKPDGSQVPIGKLYAQNKPSGSNSDFS